MHAVNLPLRSEFDRIDRMRCAARHLAMACRTLALISGGDEAETARYKRAEARFRSLADADPAGLEPAFTGSPAVAMDDLSSVRLVDLLDVAEAGGILPSRSIDPDVVDVACHLLRDFVWHIPAAG